MLNDIWRGISCFPDAWELIRRFGLQRYFIIPGVIGVAFMSLVITASILWLPGLADRLVHAYPEWMQIGVIGTITAVLMYFLAILLGLITGRYVAQILMAPVLSHLSETVENAMAGRKIPGPGIQGMISDIFRSLWFNIRNFCYEIILCLLLALIPGINVAAPVTVFLVQSYFIGFNLYDYTLERKRMGIGQAVKWMRSRMGLALGTGAVVNLFYLIPIIGWIAGPVLGTVGATKVAVEELGKTRKS